MRPADSGETGRGTGVSLPRASDGRQAEARAGAIDTYTEACEAYCLAPATIFRSMTFLAASIAGSSVSRRVGVPFSLRNCWMNESS